MLAIDPLALPEDRTRISADGMPTAPIRVALLLCLVALPAISGCGPQEDTDLPGMARAIAAQLDTVNGLPTAILDEYLWQAGSTAWCAEPGDAHGGCMGAEVLGLAFAEAREIPVVQLGPSAVPPCRWHEPGSREPGLWAGFVGPPEVQGDSARVELATVCRGFEQVHGFFLHLVEGEWRVVRRELFSIT